MELKYDLRKEEQGYRLTVELVDVPHDLKDYRVTFNGRVIFSGGNSDFPDEEILVEPGKENKLERLLDYPTPSKLELIFFGNGRFITAKSFEMK